MGLKPLKKKEIKNFVKTYHKILEIMCELYNLKEEKVGKADGKDWVVGELDAKLAAANQLHIAVPDDGSLDIIKMMRENNSTSKYELVRISTDELTSKKKLKKRLKNNPKIA